MKKHEIIKHAYENYPKGTVYTWAKDTLPREVTSSGKFYFKKNELYNDLELHDQEDKDLAVWNGEEWAEIVKPKIAVKVDNAKQADAIYMHFGSGYKGELNTSILIYIDKDIKSMGCNGTWDFVGNQPSDYQIIQFAEFAKERGIKLPHITTHDGVDLYEGDIYYCVYLTVGNWELMNNNKERTSVLSDMANVIKMPSHYKAFSTKQAALSWIEAQKPKTKIIDLNHEFSLVANCSKESVSIQYREGVGNPIVFTKEMIYSIVDTLKELE